MHDPPDKSRLLAKMKADWNARAREGAAYHIATHNYATDREFAESGARDVACLFRDLEHLVHRDQVVLDIGCGMGRMDAHVAPRVKKLVGIDVSGEMVAAARARLGPLGNVEFMEGDGCSLRPLLDRSFGLVFSHIVFQHMPREAFELYVAEAFRVLDREGSFVFQVPDALEGLTAEPPLDDTFEMRFHREPEVRRLVEGSGFAWRGAARFRVNSPTVTFDQLRVHAQRPGR
jgi:SAM-dependent methyltransferase